MGMGKEPCKWNVAEGTEGTDITNEDIEEFKVEFFLLINCLASRNCGVCWDVNPENLEECNVE